MCHGIWSKWAILIHLWALNNEACLVHCDLEAPSVYTAQAAIRKAKDPCRVCRTRPSQPICASKKWEIAAMCQIEHWGMRKHWDEKKQTHADWRIQMRCFYSFLSLLTCEPLSSISASSSSFSSWPSCSSSTALAAWFGTPLQKSQNTKRPKWSEGKKKNQDRRWCRTHEDYCWENKNVTKNHETKGNRNWPWHWTQNYTERLWQRMRYLHGISCRRITAQKEASALALRIETELHEIK